MFTVLVNRLRRGFIVYLAKMKPWIFALALGEIQSNSQASVYLLFHLEKNIFCRAHEKVMDSSHQIPETFRKLEKNQTKDLKKIIQYYLVGFYLF